MISAKTILAPALLLASAAIAAGTAPGQVPMPCIVQKDGRYALFVDGAPYLILGAQVNNSSAWPGMLPKVWPAIEYLAANTVEMPVYWEQFEPAPGRFDTSIVDTLLARRARIMCGSSYFGSAPGRMAARITCRCG